MNLRASRSLSWDDIFAHSQQRTPSHVWSSSALLAEREVAIDCDDDALFDDFFAAFGGSPRVPLRPSATAFVSASIFAGDAQTEYGCMRLRRDGQPHAVDDVFFGLSLPDCPFESRASADGQWTEVAMPGEAALFVYRDDICLFRKSHADWRPKLLSVLYRGSLRLREDVIFFHASALSIGGRGVLITGRKMSGKSTTALALAARGHAILADSCACYAPATGKLFPFRRPVGIREGPRSNAVNEALSRTEVRGVHRDASFRVDLATLLPRNESGPVAASAIFFLRGFAPLTRIETLKNDAAELANLRPMYSSFANAPHTKRVFELIRLLSRARLYGLWPGDPDETAKSIEEILA